MTSRERLLCALSGGRPDRVPYAEVGVAGRVIEQLAHGGPPAKAEGGIDEMDARGTASEIDVSRLLSRDHVCYRLTPPVPVDRQEGADSIVYYGQGRIRSQKDLDELVLPDPDAMELEDSLREFAASAGDYAACLVTRAGISPVYLAMGMEAFALALYDDLPLVEALLDRYSDWSARVCRKAAMCGFDMVWTADDLAFKTGPLMSPDMFRRTFLPYLRRVSDAISLPWVLHSDGDLATLMPDLVDLGISGLNPVEPGAMDIVEVKREWGDRICLLGNVDVNTLALGL
jgi:uroporphyrinogen decarboxylase